MASDTLTLEQECLATVVLECGSVILHFLLYFLDLRGVTILELNLLSAKTLCWCFMHITAIFISSPIT